jgi:sugar/nucleoside kinase (ribokinase family)
VIDNIEMVLSGNGGNVSTVLARLGIPVEVAAYSGADPIGEQFRVLLHKLGVGIGKLLRHPSTGTGMSIITLNPNGERSIMLVNGANELFELDTVPDEWLNETQLVAVLSVFLLPQFTGASVARLFARAKAQGARTLLNICWDTENQGLASLKPALALTDYFILNIDEARQLTGKHSPQEQLTCLEEYTTGVVVLTLGADGCCWKEAGGKPEYVPALSVDAVDTTGAGDSFIAGFSAGLMKNYALGNCVRLGCITASFAVTGTGTYSRIPDFNEIDQLRQKLYTTT